MYDVIVRNGLIVDGTGREPYVGDVAIAAGKIAEVGRVTGKARREVDATGLAVAPGFIDPHTHYDGQITWDPDASCSNLHGVTTVVMGNCGFGFAPCKPAQRETLMRMMVRVEGMSLDAMTRGIRWEFETVPEFLAMLERNGLGINVATLVGHSCLRQYVMGERAWTSPATEADLVEMENVLGAALDAGALGFSTSIASTHVGETGLPVPSRVAAHDELRRLAAVLGKKKKGVLQVSVHASGDPGPLDLLADLGRISSRPVVIGSVRFDPGAPEKHRDMLARFEKLQAEGVMLIPQVDAFSMSVDFTVPDAYPFYRFTVWRELIGSPRETWPTVLRDAGFRARFEANVREHRREFLFAPGQPIRVHGAHRPENKKYEGMSVVEIGAARGVRPLDAFFDLALEDDLMTEFEADTLNTDEAAVAEILRNESTLLAGSDAGAHLTLFCHAGQTSRLLGYWVRERKLLSLAEGVRRITSAPAKLFGFDGRGTLEAGMNADVVVFDPARIDDGVPSRVYDMPDGGPRLMSSATGIEWCFVNGVATIEQGTHAATARPGRIERG